jgi:tetratricopeptide (TPR) repeat protein
LNQVIEIGLALATALENLHAHGLVHRDVKPSNIIFVGGRPKLADIGLVAAAAGDDDSRSIVGTEGYLPPEGVGTPSADLFALGKVLYEAVTGLDRRQFPQLPPDLRSRSDIHSLVELNEILLKACSHDLRNRYRSAAAMLRDLRLLSAGKSVRSANSIRFWCQLGKRTGLWSGIGAAALGILWSARHSGRQPVVHHSEQLSTNSAANRLYDRGRLYFEQTTGNGFKKSADYFEAAIRADPNFTQAYASLALTYTWSIDGWSGNCWTNLPKAREMAIKALALDDSLPEPHLALGMFDVMREWAWDEAEHEFRQAIQINGDKPVFHYFYGEYLRMRGRTKDALDEMTQAFNLDRLSICSNVRLADFFMAARRYEDTLEQADQAIAMEPFSHSYGWTFRIRALTALGRYPEAIEAEQKDRVLWGETSAEVDSEIQNLRKAFASDGPAAYWREKLSRTETYEFYWRARAYSQLGDRTNALENLKQAASFKDAWLTFYVMTDWTLDPVREDPRFQAILKDMHLR